MGCLSSILPIRYTAKPVRPPRLETDNQDHTLRFRRDTHGRTFPCFFKILFFFKGFSKSYDIFTTQMRLGVTYTAPHAHSSTFKTTNMPTCTRSTHTISRRVHMSKCSTYFASHISPWSRCHLLAGNNADHPTVARLHFYSKRFGGPRLSACSKTQLYILCYDIFFFRHSSSFQTRTDHCNYNNNPPTTFTALQIVGFAPVCYEGVIVTCYNQVKSLGRKRKEKYSRNSFSFFFICKRKRVSLPLEES